MHQPSVLVLLACLLALSTAAGAKQVFLSGATLRTPCSSSLAMDADLYTALLFSLIGQSPKKPVDIQTSAEMDRVLQPYASLQPGSLLSLHVSGVPDLDGIIDSQQGHQVAVKGLDKLRASPLASVLSQGLSAGLLDHSPLGMSSSCSYACLEQLLKEALGHLNGNYTAGTLPFKGTIALPSASGGGSVEMSLAQTAAQAWATEVALLHASGVTADAQAANREQAGGQRKPVVLEGKLQSPKLLAAAHGSGAPETTAAISALGGAIQRLQQQLSSAFEGRLALHMTASNEPLKKADVKAALALKDSQGRRRLMSSVAASGRSARRDGLGFMAGAFAWITGLIILAFAIASCQVLGSMQFKQDSLLYGRAKTD